MKIVFLSCCAAFLLCNPFLKADPLLLKGSDRLAICGDGTANPGYAACLETYLIISGSISAEVNDFSATTSGSADFLVHLEANLASYKLTSALVLLGPAPGDDAAGSTYRQRVTGLVEALKKDGVRTIVVGSPPCADPSKSLNNAGGADAMNQSLAALANIANIAKDVAAKEGVAYADVFGSTTAAMTKARTLYGDSYAFETEGPGSPSNLVVAYAFLKALGFSGNIGSVTVNLKNNRVMLSPGQWLKGQNPGLSIQTFTDPFSWFSSGKNSGDIRKCFPFDDDLSRYILTVTNAPTAQTKITWGDENHDFSAAELAAGINLSGEFSVSPFSEMIGAVMREVAAKQARERAAHEADATHPDEEASSTAWNAVTQSALSDLAHFAQRSFRQTLAIQPLAAPLPQPPGPIPVIVDTDMDSDIDDVAALALLNDFMDQGECTLLACLHDTTDGKDLSSCATIEAINTYYGHPSIPIGQAYGEDDPSVHRTSILAPAPAEGYHSVPGSWSTYTLKVHQRFDPTFPNDDKMPPAVDVYRKTLAAAADGTVVICSIGNMQSFQDLLLSQPDSVSNLNGVDLVRKKVRELVIMFNTVPQDKYLLSKWPTKILWSTDIGNHIALGKSLLNTPENNPVRVIFNGGTRQGWDPTAAWLAARGTGDVYDIIAGDQPNVFFSTVKMPDYQVQKLFDDELARPPKY
jgi:hypothetical protein